MGASKFTGKAQHKAGDTSVTNGTKRINRSLERLSLIMLAIGGKRYFKAARGKKLASGSQTTDCLWRHLDKFIGAATNNHTSE